MSDISKVHEVRTTLHQDVYYPAHAPRDESPEYRTIHHQLVVEEDRPCYICGKKYSEGSPNETHHVWVEWSLANAVDPAKVSAVAHTSLDKNSLPDWVDHAPGNLLVLCPDHHRHNEMGIHSLSFPIWVAQKFVQDGVLLTDISSPGSNQ